MLGTPYTVLLPSLLPMQASQHIYQDNKHQVHKRTSPTRDSADVTSDDNNMEVGLAMIYYTLGIPK